MIECFYALGGINYKNGVISTCPRQADQLVFADETTLPSEIYNHKNFKDLRSKLYNNEWPSGCDSCEEMERDGLKSMRLDFSLIDNWFCKEGAKDKREGSNDSLISLYNDTTHEVGFKGLRHVEIRFSNACNFACLHCSKVFSTGWTKKIQNYKPDIEVIQNDLKQLMGTEHRHGSEDKSEMQLSTEDALKIVEDLNENFPNVEFIDFAGGELLYQKQFFPTLKKLAEHPNAKNMLISFHTNFNADFNVNELTTALEPFKESCIIISIDAGQKIYSYFRHGGTWNKLKQNIQDFKQINTFTHIDISCTTSIYQILEIEDVFKSFYELDCNMDASIVQTPKYINPSIAMYDFEKEILKDLRSTEDFIMKNLGPEKYDFKKWFDYIADYVKRTRLEYRHYNRWLVYRKKSDEIWQQNFNDYFQNYQIDNGELIRA
jgi:MoaA/NifB/PqqE/SkfB family radical SAM enzyme|tara:strand:+ start:11412 stop:12710 length:1299 start_codon:yes stop_codon:yes gene_type:complete